MDSTQFTAVLPRLELIHRPPADSPEKKGDDEMRYDPTRVETRKAAEWWSRLCPNCLEEFTRRRDQMTFCCSEACQEEYNELGPYERVSPFDQWEDL